MAHGLTVLMTLAQNWIQFPAPIWLLVTYCNSSSRDSDNSFGLQGIPMMYIHTCRQNAHGYIKKNKNEFGSQKIA